jgi:two-component system sensor histidine kinase MprB
MSLRTRLTLAGGGAVFVALTIASLVIYFEVRSKLHDQIDVSLIQLAQNVATKTLRTNTPAASSPSFLGTRASGYFQVIPSLGKAVKTKALPGGVAPTTSTPTVSTKTPLEAKVASPQGNLAAPNRFVPLTNLDGAVAGGLYPPYFRDVEYHGVALRMYAMRLSSTGDGLVRTARPLTEANATITRVRWLLFTLTIGGALAAALLGWLAANTVLRPVRALAGAVREVSATRDLNRRIPVSGRDELASLAADFNTMLAALEESQRAQQQLIADASHELRTPLTAHRANIELLARPDLPVERRQRVLAAAVRGIEELSALVGDLIQAARSGRSVDAREPLAFDELAGAAVERARHRAPELRFEARLEPHQIVGARARLERAIDNVLDNAIKWSPSGGTIDVELRAGTLTVRDHGPGIEGADLPHVFDRFYRSASARGLPGSGLGLAIVKQTVDDHGGSVAIANAAGGGTVVTIHL